MDRRYASLVFLLHPNRGRPRTIYIRRVVFYALALAFVAGIPAAVWGAFELGQVCREKSIACLEAEAARSGGLARTRLIPFSPEEAVRTWNPSWLSSLAKLLESC